MNAANSHQHQIMFIEGSWFCNKCQIELKVTRKAGN